jgi:hypothetical protein
MADLWTEEFILGSDTIVHVNGADKGGVETRLSFPISIARTTYPFTLDHVCLALI